MGFLYFLVDAFTDRPFAGNPAVVCLLPAWVDDAWLQNVAREMNQSETAFLVQNGDGFDLRWFTPRVEVDLCGHATLAAAHIVWVQGLAVPGEEIRFATKSGILSAGRHGGEIELDFPLTPEVEASAPPGLIEALGVSPRYVGRNQFDYLVEIESDSVLRELAPDFRLLATVSARGTIVTSRSADPRFDFVSRFFAPAAGIDEDPVTGSAHCCLGDYWRKRLGKSQFVAYQASARGGVVRVRVSGDRAFLGGKAVAVSKGELMLPENLRCEPADTPSTDALRIRAYAEVDESQVVELWRKVFPNNPPWNNPKDDIERKLAIQRNLFLVAEKNGQIVGTVMAGFDGHRGWVHLVAVAAQWRQQGIGAALMNEAERRLRNIGCTKINLQVRANNPEVVSFYESLGYSVENRISMGKRLT